MIALRPLRWPDDRASLLALDTSFTTDRVFHLQQTNHGFKLDEAAAEPPIHKSYSLVDGVELIPSHDWVTIAEHNHRFAGVASMTRPFPLCNVTMPVAGGSAGVFVPVVILSFIPMCPLQRRTTHRIAQPPPLTFRPACFRLGRFSKVEDLPTTLPLCIKRQTPLLPLFNSGTRIKG